MTKPTRNKIIIAVNTLFAVAAAFGTTLLTPEQRETILQILPTIMAVFGL